MRDPRSPKQIMRDDQDMERFMKRKPLTPEQVEALNSVMRKACERMELAKAERDADKLAEQVGRLADELGYNV
jgi:hypothetical protein